MEKFNTVEFSLSYHYTMASATPELAMWQYEDGRNRWDAPKLLRRTQWTSNVFEPTHPTGAIGNHVKPCDMAIAAMANNCRTMARDMHPRKPATKDAGLGKVSTLVM